MKRNGFITPVGKLMISGTLVTALAFGLAIESQAAKGGGGGGKDKPGQDEVGQIIPVQLIFDEQHVFTGENNGLVSDLMRNDPGDPASYVHGEDGALIDVGENFSIVLDPNNTGKSDPARSFDFPQGVTVLGGLSCDDLAGGECEPDLGTKKVKGQEQPILACGDTSGPVLTADGRAPDAEMIFWGDNHDDSPVGCVRHVNASLKLTDANGVPWFVAFGGRPFPGGFMRSPCGSCVEVERLPNSDGHAIWTFHTEPPHYGYLYRDGNTELHGVVSLPFSGMLISLEPEPEPTALNCDAFEDAGDCPTGNL